MLGQDNPVILDIFLPESKFKNILIRANPKTDNCYLDVLTKLKMIDNLITLM